MTLKQAAENLNINYSTAKTIVQTYRKEKRISKKPKHTIETKKSMKRENFLSKVLTHDKVAKVMSRIISTEFKTGKKRKLLKTKNTKFSHVISEAQTLPATGQAPENLVSKSFPRIESAGQMQLFEPEKEGPKTGQITRAVFADIPQVLKKDIFYIHCKPNTEEELKELIDYNDPLVLKSKPEPQMLKSVIQEELAHPSESIVELRNSSTSENNKMKTVSAFTVVHKGEEVMEPGLYFDFREYGSMIMENVYERYRRMYNKGNDKLQI